LGRFVKHLTTTAKVPHPWSFDHDHVGFNYRLPNINAALGVAQLENLPNYLQRKRRLAAHYQDAFSNLEGIRFFNEPPFSKSNYWLNAIFLDTDFQQDRDDVLKFLVDRGIKARPAWTLMHKLSMYSHCPRGDVTVSEEIERRLINIPSSVSLAE
jgi:perosamine synthetase